MFGNDDIHQSACNQSRYTSLLPASITTFIPSFKIPWYPRRMAEAKGPARRMSVIWKHEMVQLFWCQYSPQLYHRQNNLHSLGCHVIWSSRQVEPLKRRQETPGVRRSRTRSIEFQQWILSRFNESRAGNMDFSWSVFRNRNSRVWIDPEYWRINWCLTPALQSGYQIMCSRVGIYPWLFSMKLVSHSRGSKRTWDVESWCYLLLC